MFRKIIQIDEEKCNGCGQCIPNCHEGALQIIDGKARLVSDLFCDGLGACLGYCPEGAIEVIEREAQPYDEALVMQEIVKKGRNTILAHLEHLRDHNENDLLKQAVAYIKQNNIDMSPDAEMNSQPESSAVFNSLTEAQKSLKPETSCGCGSSKPIDFKIDMDKVNLAASPTAVAISDEAGETMPAPSELRQWPVQLHLLNPAASYFRDADVILTADCVAFAMGDFHNRMLKDRSLAIACPKLDTNKESYVEKLTAMIAQSLIRSLEVIIMEVPCCGGLMQIANIARQQSGRDIPIKKTVIGIKGDVLFSEMN